MDDPLSPPTLPPEAPDERGPAGSISEPADLHGQDDAWVPAAPATSPAAAAGEALRALAHVARSFMLYDATNERIRGFLEDVRAKIEHFLGTHGEMRLEIRPWDIVLGGDVVSSDRDRERSLAFRLYRDGVRRLTLHPELEWSELIMLIGILSVRYKGVRTQEDDVVTLLWRADFKHIDVVAVEGLVASEDDAVDLPSLSDGKAAGPRDAMQAMVFNAPYGFNYPWPNWTERATVERRSVPPPLLSRIAEEEGAHALPLECLQLVRELLAGISDPHDPLAPGEVIPVLYELRGFLVGDLCLDALLGMVRMVRAMPGISDETRKELLAACVAEDVVRRFAVALDPADEGAVAALTELVELAPGDHVSTLLDLFTGSPRHQDSQVVRRLLETHLKGRTTALVERLGALDPAVAIELFRLLVRADPAGSIDAAVVLLGRAEPSAQLEALQLLETAEYSGKIGRALVGALGSDSSDVRLRALATLVRRHESRAFEPIVNRIKLGTAELEGAETKAVGEAMARLEPQKALSVFKEWVRPSGLLGRLGPGQTALRRAAIEGLALLPGRESEELLQWLARHGGDDLGQQCDRALARLRGHEGDHRG
ncbi:MAG: hypothetical protein ABR961_01695 [Thermoanaerobaculaceae bacterium]